MLDVLVVQYKLIVPKKYSTLNCLHNCTRTQGLVTFFSMYVVFILYFLANHAHCFHVLLTFDLSRSTLLVNSSPTWKRAPVDQSPNQLRTHLLNRAGEVREEERRREKGRREREEGER